MPDRVRTHEVRLLLSVIIDLDDPELSARLAQRRQPSSLSQAVADEVAAHLESVSYVDVVFVTSL
jgi:hypothetical protein